MKVNINICYFYTNNLKSLSLIEKKLFSFFFYSVPIIPEIFILNCGGIEVMQNAIDWDKTEGGEEGEGGGKKIFEI